MREFYIRDQTSEFKTLTGDEQNQRLDEVLKAATVSNFGTVQFSTKNA